MENYFEIKYFLMKMASKGIKEFDVSDISDETEIEFDIVKSILKEFHAYEFITAFDAECPACKNFNRLGESEKDIYQFFGKHLICNKCDNMVKINPEDVYVRYIFTDEFMEFVKSY